MLGTVLKNKPLVEAIFQLQWELQETGTELKTDPNYGILLGRLYDRIESEYPFHERLPTADIPDEIAAYVVQHRFRKGEGEWPLVQLGPGIMTVNDTEGYVWQDFQQRACTVTAKLRESYPQPQGLKIERLLLRYIDSVSLDREKNNALDFLRDYLKTRIELQPELFEDTGVSRVASNLDLRFSFPCDRPTGAMNVRFALGNTRGQEALIWETVVQSTGAEVPEDTQQIPAWLEEAHCLTHDWFFKMIEGELRRRFE